MTESPKPAEGAKPLARHKKPPGKITQHWMVTAYDRICAGESEASVMHDYGWQPDAAPSPEGVGLTDAERIEKLALALAFYADPDTYFAASFLFDPPCGEFNTDFSYDSDFRRPVPGKRARETLRELQIVEWESATYAVGQEGPSEPEGGG